MRIPIYRANDSSSESSSESSSDSSSEFEFGILVRLSLLRKILRGILCLALVYEEQYGEATSCLQSLSKQLKRMEALSVQKCSFARVSTREGGLKVIWVICASSSQSPLSNTR
jgi:hypothetical protein